MKLILLPVWQFSSMKPTAHSHIYPLGVDNKSVQVAPFWQSLPVSQGAGKMNKNTIRLHKVEYFLHSEFLFITVTVHINT